MPRWDARGLLLSLPLLLLPLPPSSPLLLLLLLPLLFVTVAMYVRIPTLLLPAVTGRGAASTRHRGNVDLLGLGEGLPVGCSCQITLPSCVPFSSRAFLDAPFLSLSLPSLTLALPLCAPLSFTLVSSNRFPLHLSSTIECFILVRRFLHLAPQLSLIRTIVTQLS